MHWKFGDRDGFRRSCGQEKASDLCFKAAAAAAAVAVVAVVAVAGELFTITVVADDSAVTTGENYDDISQFVRKDPHT